MNSTVSSKGKTASASSARSAGRLSQLAVDTARIAEVSNIVFNIDRKFQTQSGAPRTMCWIQALRLPQNSAAYQTFTLRRVLPEAVDAALRDVNDVMPSTRERRAVSRLWASLTLHEPRVAAIPFVPYLCVAVCRGMPANPVCAFEAALTFLRGVCADWIHEFPKMPERLLSRLDCFVRATPKLTKLWQHLNEGIVNCSVQDYLWLPLQTFFLYSLAPQDWLSFMDDVVCRADGDQYFYAMAIGNIEVRSAALLSCETVEEVHKVVTTPLLVDDARSVVAMKRCANAISLQLFLPVEPMLPLPQSAACYYPLLHVGTRPPVPVQVDKQKLLEQMEEDEEELYRRLKNELSTLVTAVDVSRFHAGLEAVEETKENAVSKASLRQLDHNSLAHLSAAKKWATPSEPQELHTTVVLPTTANAPAAAAAHQANDAAVSPQPLRHYAVSVEQQTDSAPFLAQPRTAPAATAVDISQGVISTDCGGTSSLGYAATAASFLQPHVKGSANTSRSHVVPPSSAAASET